MPVNTPLADRYLQLALVVSRDALWLKLRRLSHYCCARVHTSAFTPDMSQKKLDFLKNIVFFPEPWEHVSHRFDF